MKTYTLTLSTKFPTTHARAGEPTYFEEKLLNGEKIHTIRSNYPLWAQRFTEIEQGNAKLSVRKWSGKPYRSKQIVIKEFTKEDGIGLQRIRLAVGHLIKFEIDFQFRPESRYIIKNDGLNVPDFKEWFKDSQNQRLPMALIHFTRFRY